MGENRPGASSFIAAQAVIAAPPDGYTLFVSTNFPANVPTMQKSGNKGYEASAWSAVFGPANMEPAIIKILSDAVTELLRKPKSATFLSSLGAEIFAGTPESLKKFPSYRTGNHEGGRATRQHAAGVRYSRC